MNLIGIDLGGSKIALAKYELPDWNKVAETTVSTNSSEGAEGLVEQLVSLINEHRDEQTEAIGIGIPGPTVNGYVSKLPNIPNVKNLCLSAELAKQLTVNNKQLTVNNDSNCFTVGAWQLSKHKDKQNILGITLGTGVGGGLIINGELITGKDGVTGEFGHMIIRDGLTLQDLASGKALQKRWQETHSEEKTGAEIVEMAASGNKKALEFLEIVGQDLGIGLGNLIMAMNPDIIFLGGSASAAIPFMETKIREVLSTFRYPKATEIELIQFKNQDSATFGAAWLAKQVA